MDLKEVIIFQNVWSKWLCLTCQKMGHQKASTGQVGNKLSGRGRIDLVRIRNTKCSAFSTRKNHVVSGAPATGLAPPISSPGSSTSPFERDCWRHPSRLRQSVVVRRSDYDQVLLRRCGTHTHAGFGRFFIPSSCGFIVALFFRVGFSIVSGARIISLLIPNSAVEGSEKCLVYFCVIAAKVMVCLIWLCQTWWSSSFSGYSAPIEDLA